MQVVYVFTAANIPLARMFPSIPGIIYAAPKPWGLIPNPFALINWAAAVDSKAELPPYPAILYIWTCRIVQVLHGGRGEQANKSSVKFLR
ncbi:hypothetical protein CGL56_09665 [Neolewinella marina]|uniref:Uncharacterized protein n=1 Tax=Neolewinella marina TaxID=438751 RepID=A0A2G0CFH4_9BACT|nr:hypothetical protein CGL56_09665 [Neolewinella marina]